MHSNTTISRRDFLRLSALGVAGLSIAGITVSCRREQGASETVVVAEQGAPPSRSPLLLEKSVPAEWEAALLPRGAEEVYSGADLETIGMPVGGIAAGQLYVLGDGSLGLWEIDGVHEWLGFGLHNYERRVPRRPVRQGIGLLAGPVRHRMRFFPLADVRPEYIRFHGQYPIARIDYDDPNLPARVSLEVFSPFIPLNAEDSSLPATILNVTVHEVRAGYERVHVVAWLENPVCRHSAELGMEGMRTTRIERGNGRTMVVHGAEDAPPPDEAPPSDDARPPVLIDDFERDDWGGWTATGNAFGEGPVAGSRHHQILVCGFEGRRLATSGRERDRTTGRLLSPAFTITRRYLNFLHAGGWHEDQTCINLLVDGEVVRTVTGNRLEKLTWHSWDVAELEGREARIEMVDEVIGNFGYIAADQFELADTPREGTGNTSLDSLKDNGTMVLALDGEPARAEDIPAPEEVIHDVYTSIRFGETEPFPISERRNFGVMSRAIEAPASVRLAVAWHFPRYEPGRYYAARFGDAAEVAAYLFDNSDRLTAETHAWHRAFYDSTLPHWLLNRIHATVCCLASGTCEWWANGRFWAFEGVVSAHGTCTHVWNYAQGAAYLFPELERSAREMQDFGEGFHPDTGLVGFRGDDAYAADGQAGTVLKAYREHLQSTDDAFLRRNWTSIRKALEYLIREDGNGNGLIEGEQHNTYDIEFFGANTFVGGLYLAALRAGGEMARIVGDEDFAEQTRRIFESGNNETMSRLWNGEYFVQEVDLTAHPEQQYADGCLSDQLFGQTWAHQLGLGYVYTDDATRTALEAVFRHNWFFDVGPYRQRYPPFRNYADPGEAGLIICTWPHSEHLENGLFYRNEVWTGIEYQVAAGLIREGLVTEGLAIVRGVHERYHPRKRNPFNEVECGDHYARAMASWGVLMALSGYRHDGPAGMIAFNPPVTPDDFRSVYTASEGWGRFSQQRSSGEQRNAVTVDWGRLRLRELRLGLPEGIAAVPRVRLSGASSIPGHNVSVEDGGLVVVFTSDLVLTAGEELAITVDLGEV